MPWQRLRLLLKTVLTYSTSKSKNTHNISIKSVLLHLSFLGGVVLIAGTGSACRYLNDAGEIFGTGGNGHLIEESGGGFWISQRLI